MSKYVMFFLIFVLSFVFFSSCDKNSSEPKDVTQFNREVLARIYFNEPISLWKLKIWTGDNSGKVELAEVNLSFEKSSISLMLRENVNLLLDAISFVKGVDEDAEFLGVRYIHIWTSKDFFYGDLSKTKNFFVERVDNVEYLEVAMDEKPPLLAGWIPRWVKMTDEISLSFYFDEYNDFDSYKYLDIVIEIDNPITEKFSYYWLTNLPGAHFIYDGNEDGKNIFRIRVEVEELLLNEFVYSLYLPLENRDDPMNINLMAVTFDVVSGGSCNVVGDEPFCSFMIEHSDFSASSSRSKKHGGKDRLSEIKYLF
ncbi:MAG: hypothetical protein L3J07_00995 [Candidatus Magasanikbacteria bacterium]|nr:hypothetical protein [Candidatus Magasanikbacteria bacterium]